MSAFPLSTNCRVSSGDLRLLPCRVAGCSIPLPIPFTSPAGQRLLTGMMPPSQARYIPYQKLAPRESRVGGCPVASARLLLPAASLQPAGQRLRPPPVEVLLCTSSIDKRGGFRQRWRNPLHNLTFPDLESGGMERRCWSCYYPVITQGSVPGGREARDRADARAGAPEGTEHTPDTPRTPNVTHERR